MKCKLADICTKIGSGATPRGGKEAYCDKGISLVRSQNILDFSFSNNGLVFINDEQAAKLDNVEVFDEDVLLNITGDSVARACMINSAFLPARVNQHVAIIRGKKDCALNRYLLYFLQWKKEYLLQLASAGATRNALTKGMIEQLEIDLPSINEQKKIVALLGGLDDKIELNNKINENLERQAQAIYQEWFVDLEPFGTEMPSDWFVGTVDDLAKEVVCGKTPSTKKTEYYGSDIPFVTIPDMHGNIYTVTTERYLSVLGANSQAKKSLPKNTVCVSCIGTAGLVTLVAEESQTNQQINSIIPKDGFSPYYIYFLMKSHSNTINKFGQSGSTIVDLNKSQFGKIQVTIPSLPTMTKFDEIVSPIFEKILQIQKENLNLSSLRDTILPKLMSGEIDIEDVNI